MLSFRNTYLTTEKTMLVKEITQILNTLFPLSLQEDYDNTGSQIAFPDSPVTGILLALDIDQTVLREALDRNCEMIITHHPLFFSPLKRIDAADPRSALILSIIEKRISLFSLHTNLDRVYYDRLGRALGFPEGRVLLESRQNADAGAPGFGTLTGPDSPITLRELLKRIKERLDLEFIVYSGDPDMEITTVALLNGSGGSSIDRIIRTTGADCIITGDVGYHHCRAAAGRHAAVIDAGHFGTERILLPYLREQLAGALKSAFKSEEAALYISEAERNPFSVFL